MTIEFCDVTFQYNDIKLLKGINFKINSGSWIGIKGDSGSGKSTICNLISGIIPRNIKGKLSGKIFLDGRNIKSFSFKELVENVGIVFQDPNRQLFSISVLDEMAFSLENFNYSREDMVKIIDKTLKVVGIEKLKNSTIQSLSGGQKQLVALASVLVLNPKILILDEALSQLDDISTDRMLKVIKKINQLGTTVIMVEHSDDKLVYVDKIFCLDDCELKEI